MRLVIFSNQLKIIDLVRYYHSYQQSNLAEAYPIPKKFFWKIFEKKYRVNSYEMLARAPQIVKFVDLHVLSIFIAFALG
jgi:hypothetical protein